MNVSCRHHEELYYLGKVKSLKVLTVIEIFSIVKKSINC